MERYSPTHWITCGRTALFNAYLGTSVSTQYGEALQVWPHAIGHAVYGPYEPMAPGLLRVDFPLGIVLDEQPDPGQVYATIEVVSYKGEVTLASRDISGAELAQAVRAVSLEFVNREFRALEYRVQVTGRGSIVVGTPYAVPIGGGSSVRDGADPREPSVDPVELQQQVRAVLRLLKPRRARGHDKIRLGRSGDGGYICLDDFRPGDIALSLGINDDISWDLAVADRGLTIHQFDHTVEDPAPDDDRMTFNKLMIAAASGPGRTSLSDLIHCHDKGRRRPNLVLKMDIEGHEWIALETVSSRDLSRFSQIICEMHCFESLADVKLRRAIYDGLAKIAEHFEVVHVHGNACAGVWNVANVHIPAVIEVTFVNKALYKLSDTDELFPGPLDMSCDINTPDIYLGAFRF